MSTQQYDKARIYSEANKDKKFGTWYSTLAPAQQKDEELAHFAAIESSGHTIRRASEEVRHSFSSSFFYSLLEAGVPAWVVQYASPEVQKQEDIVELVEDLEAERKRRIREICNPNIPIHD